MDNTRRRQKWGQEKRGKKNYPSVLHYNFLNLFMIIHFKNEENYWITQENYWSVTLPEYHQVSNSLLSAFVFKAQSNSGVTQMSHWTYFCIYLCISFIVSEIILSWIFCIFLSLLLFSFNAFLVLICNSLLKLCQVTLFPQEKLTYDCD